MDKDRNKNMEDVKIDKSNGAAGWMCSVIRAFDAKKNVKEKR